MLASFAFINVKKQSFFPYSFHPSAACLDSHRSVSTVMAWVHGKKQVFSFSCFIKHPIITATAPGANGTVSLRVRKSPSVPPPHPSFGDQRPPNDTFPSRGRLWCGAGRRVWACLPTAITGACGHAPLRNQCGTMAKGQRNPAALFTYHTFASRSSTRSVRSQGRSSSGRPKWP